MTDKRTENPRDLAGVPMNSSGSMSSKEKIKAELDKIITAKRESHPHLLADLYIRFKDDLDMADKINRLYDEHIQRTNDKIRRLAQKIYAKYSLGERPMHEIAAKIYRYRKKLNWSTADYNEFHRQLHSLATGARAEEFSFNQNMFTHRSAINRLIGEKGMVPQRFREVDAMKVSQADQAPFAEIARLYAKNLRFQANIELQSRIYEDCSEITLSGKYNKDTHVPYNYIPAYIFMLFAPRFEITEDRMIRSDLSRIIVRREKGESIIQGNSTSDYNFFQDLVINPFDVVCDSSSPMKDLEVRCKVQQVFKELVGRLRSGNYYASNTSDIDHASILESYLTSCDQALGSINSESDPTNNDSVLTGDGPEFIRRVLEIFSLRTLVAVTSPIAQHVSFMAGNQVDTINVIGNRYRGEGGKLIHPFNNSPVNTITRVPMLVMSLPRADDSSEAPNITTALEQQIWLDRNGIMVPHRFRIINCDELLIIAVRRVQHSRSFQTYLNPIAFMRTPVNVAIKRSLNLRPLIVPQSFSIDENEDRSVVILRGVLAHRYVAPDPSSEEQTADRNEGYCALVSKSGFLGAEHYVYDPVAATIPIRSSDGQGYFMNNPVSTIAFSSQISGSEVSFDEIASTRGVVFVYRKETNEIA